MLTDELCARGGGGAHFKGGPEKISRRAVNRARGRPQLPRSASPRDNGASAPIFSAAVSADPIRLPVRTVPIA